MQYLLKTTFCVFITHNNLCFVHDGAQQTDLPTDMPNTQDRTLALVTNAL